MKGGSGHPLPPSPSQFKFGSCRCSTECAVMNRTNSSLGFSYTSCFKGTNLKIFREVCRVNVWEGVHKAQVRGWCRDEQLQAQHSGSGTLQTQPSLMGTTGRDMKWWKMKGSAEIRPNINPTKINSAWLLWLIQKQLFSSELRSGKDGIELPLLCAFRSLWQLWLAMGRRFEKEILKTATLPPTLHHRKCDISSQKVQLLLNPGLQNLKELTLFS